MNAGFAPTGREVDWAHRVVEGERVARRTLLAIRGDDGHLAERLGGADEAVEPVGEDPVVVRTEETHQRPGAGSRHKAWR